MIVVWVGEGKGDGGEKGEEDGDAGDVHCEGWMLILRSDGGCGVDVEQRRRWRW